MSRFKRSRKLAIRRYDNFELGVYASANCPSRYLHILYDRGIVFVFLRHPPKFIKCDWRKWFYPTMFCLASTSLDIRSTRLSTVGDRAFPVAAARLWNSLPSHVTASPSLYIFCCRLKSQGSCDWLLASYRRLSVYPFVYLSVCPSVMLYIVATG